jgi:hypothetical protein
MARDGNTIPVASFNESVAGAIRARRKVFRCPVDRGRPPGFQVLAVPTCSALSAAAIG